MDFEAAVARGRALLARSNRDQWELAKLAYEVWEFGKRGDLTRWGERLGVGGSHVSQLKITWQRYGSLYPDQLTMSFNEYYTKASVSKERAEKLQRQADAEGTSVGTVHRRGRDRGKLETARELLRNRDGVRRVLDDPKVRASVERELRARADREAPGGLDGSEGGRGRPAQRRQRELVVELSEVQQRLSEILGRMADLQLNRDNRDRVIKIFRKLENSLGWLRTFLMPEGERAGAGSTASKGEREKAPMEEALDRILSDGSPEPEEESPGGGTGRRRRRAPDSADGAGRGEEEAGHRRRRAS